MNYDKGPVPLRPGSPIRNKSVNPEPRPKLEIDQTSRLHKAATEILSLATPKPGQPLDLAFNRLLMAFNGALDPTVPTVKKAVTLFTQSKEKHPNPSTRANAAKLLSDLATAYQQEKALASAEPQTTRKHSMAWTERLTNLEKLLIESAESIRRPAPNE